MCGYCVEQFVLQMLEKDVQGNLHMHDIKDSSGRYFYLRETPTFLTAVDRVRRSLAQKKMAADSEISGLAILHRGLEILLEQGYESLAYQLLLKKQIFRDAIAEFCTDETRMKFKTATAGLEIEYLSLLYDAETYFWCERSKQLRILANVLPSCRNLLKHYISWWLDGKNLKKNDLNKIMETTGVFDPIHDISEEEHSHFYSISTALYFSILMVGSCAAGKKMLLAIAQKEVAGVPNFDGEDLWLQRLAALKLYDLEGFKAFSKHITSIRATNYYYIDLVRGFSWEQKQFLFDEVKRQPEADRTDSFIHMSQWLGDELS